MDRSGTKQSRFRDTDRTESKSYCPLSLVQALEPSSMGSLHMRSKVSELS